MSRVSFLVLLAMALAATSVHARLDLFAQLLTSNNQLDTEQTYIIAVIYVIVQLPECQKIPYQLCDGVCNSCVCDRRVPQYAECICTKWKPVDEELQKSDVAEKASMHQINEDY
ncbi:hypothetical protein ACLB2K_057098 [Fragaria x ananassa]